MTRIYTKQIQTSDEGNDVNPKKKKKPIFRKKQHGETFSDPSSSIARCQDAIPMSKTVYLWATDGKSMGIRGHSSGGATVYLLYGRSCPMICAKISKTHIQHLWTRPSKHV